MVIAERVAVWITYWKIIKMPSGCQVHIAMRFYSGLHNFDNMMDEELGTFFLTDYLVRHFNTLIIKGMGLDRFPELKDTYFEHYKKTGLHCADQRS